MAHSQRWLGILASPVPASRGLGFLKCGSLLRLKGNFKSSYSLAFEVREYPFYHILLAKSPAEIQGCEYWEMWGGGGVQRESFLEIKYRRVNGVQLGLEVALLYIGQIR